MGGGVRATAHGRGFSQVIRTASFDISAVESQAMARILATGLATEAARASVRYGFETLRLSRIIGLVDPRNTRSVRVLEKSGLSFEKMIEYASQPAALYAVYKTTQSATD
jgi:hypothetical protein